MTEHSAEHSAEHSTQRLVESIVHGVAQDEVRRLPLWQKSPSAEHYAAFALLLLSVGLVGLCAMLGLSFVAPATWALLLAVLMQPVHRRIGQRLGYPTLTTFATMLIVVVALVLPLALAGTEIAVEVSQNAHAVQSGQAFQNWIQAMNRNPWLGKAAEWMQARVDIRNQVGSAAQTGVRFLSGLMLGSAYAIIEWLVAFYMLFFFLRDGRVLLDWIAGVLPLSRTESSGVFRRVRDTLHAVALGSLVVSLGQGLAVGLAFWAIGLPSPLMWGGIMAVLALVPVIGTSSVWVCATVYLLLQGEWQNAIVIGVCGTVALGVIDNVLYPMLVKDRLDMHPVPVFIAVVGGVVCFGPTGIVLGPLILSLSQAVRHIWRARFEAEARVG
jgi:predicted PurR-regulated permease PerM